MRKTVAFRLSGSVLRANTTLTSLGQLGGIVEMKDLLDTGPRPRKDLLFQGPLMRQLTRIVLFLALGAGLGAASALLSFPQFRKLHIRSLPQRLSTAKALRHDGLAGISLSRIERFADGKLVLGTAGEGAWLFEPRTRRVVRLRDSEGRFTVGAVTCLLPSPGQVFVITFSGETYIASPSSVAAQLPGLAPVYGCEAGPDGKYLFALWRGVMLVDTERFGRMAWLSPPALLVAHDGVTSAVLIGNGCIAWSRADGAVFRGCVHDQTLVEAEPLAALPMGPASLVWFKQRRLLIATYSDRSLMLEGGRWRPLEGPEGTLLRVLSCQHMVGDGCWAEKVPGGFGVFRSDGTYQELVAGFPYRPLAAFADNPGRRVYVGTLGGGLWSFGVGGER